jgi:erythronate-4-phosphate dehydrogenase
MHTPLNDTTYHLLRAESIGLMKDSGVIINASRGEVADTEALLAAPQTLLIDVWEREPKIDARLLEKAFVATPHIAGYSAQGKANAAMMVIEAIAEEFGLPLKGWYPAEVRPVSRVEISWAEMCATIANRCNLKGETEYLKSHPVEFEQMRDNYAYREEYF